MKVETKKRKIRRHQWQSRWKALHVDYDYCICISVKWDRVKEMCVSVWITLSAMQLNVCLKASCKSVYRSIINNLPWHHVTNSWSIVLTAFTLLLLLLYHSPVNAFKSYNPENKLIQNHFNHSKHKIATTKSNTIPNKPQTKLG